MYQIYREVAILKELGKFHHQHLLSHIQAWYDDSYYYTLLPLAYCDLRTTLQENEVLQLTSDEVLWLLTQLAGLADALKTVHNPSAANSPGRTKLKKTTGYHGDLKPDNILGFLDQFSGDSKLVIADFGSSALASSTESEEPESLIGYPPLISGGIFSGTPAYQGPEAASAGLLICGAWVVLCLGY